VTRTWAVDTAFARVQLRFKRFPSQHTLLLCIAARAFALPVEVDSSQHCAALAIHAVHPSSICLSPSPPPPPPLPPPAILDFVQTVAACCCLSFPLSCAAVLHGAAGGVATHSFPSSFCPSLLCACAGSPPNRARCTLSTTCHRHPHRVWHRICRHRCVHVCRHSQRFATYTAVDRSHATVNRVACARQPQLMSLSSPHPLPLPLSAARKIFSRQRQHTACAIVL
jgi:hypothetical protein